MNFRTLDLNLLRVFDAVMEERHVTRAAERLAMTQPAVSNALRRLRDALADELFVPGPGGVIPTRRAEAVWPAVHAALQSVRAVIEPARFDPQADERDFTVVMADATAAVFMPLLMADWLGGGIRSTLRVISLHTRDPRPLLERGEADAAVGFFPDVARELAAAGNQGPARLDPLYDCEYRLVMRQGHALSGLAVVDVDAYCSAQHLRVDFADRPRGYVDEALWRLGRTRRVVLTVNLFSTAGRVVSRTDLLTVLPRSFIPATGMAEALCVRPLPLQLPAINVSLLWHRRHEHDAAHAMLRDALARTARSIAADLLADVPRPTGPRESA